MRSRLILLSACIALAALPGCQPASTGNAGSSRPGTVAEVVQWPFAPESIRVHPLSRIKFGPGDSKPQVQGRVEFLDQDGFSTRGVGTLKIILAGSSGSGSHAESRWECDLNNLETNSQYYDEVTRTYLYSLSLHETDDVPLEPILHVTLALPDGRVLSDEAVIHVSRFQPPSEDLDD